MFGGFVVRDVRVSDVPAGDTLVHVWTRVEEDSGGFLPFGGGGVNIVVPPDGAGVYALTLNDAIKSATGAGSAVFQVTRGGATVILASGMLVVNDGGNYAACSISRVVRLLAGDVLAASVFNKEGAAKPEGDIEAYFPTFMGVFFGP